jgi:hypothetical protein
VVLVVDEIEAAREELVARGVAVSEVFHDDGGQLHHAGTAGRVPGPDPERSSYPSRASFSDPDEPHASEPDRFTEPSGPIEDCEECLADRQQLGAPADVPEL